MKGVQAVIVAVGLGLSGAIVNCFYLSSEAQKVEMVSFIGVKPGIVIGRSEPLKVDNLVKVQIPLNAVGNLKQFAFRWDELNTVKDRATWRTIDSTTNGASLLFRSDVQTPPAELELGKNETAQAVPIDSKLVVMSLIKPGAWVSFRVPTAPSLTMPTPARPPITTPSPAPGAVDSAGASGAGSTLQPEPDKTSAPSPEASEIIGRFKVLSVGNRLGDADVMRAAKIPQLQENILEIRVSEKETGEKERFEHLWNRLQAVGFHGVSVIIHGKED